jgi:2-polyprenyl-3-methyl-5-hydroxy-6-metoxy-1,4-benzoquinol methylase
MYFLEDAPSESALAAFYQNYASAKYPNRLTRLKMMKQSLFNPYLRILRETGGIKGKSILDVGCSHGEFLLQMSGARLFGYDIDTSCRAQLEASGITFLPSLTGQFDVITVMQVLEHLREPGRLLNQLRHNIAGDGRLLVALPNGGEIDRIGNGWVGFRVDLEHLNYFTISTLTALLERCGFQVDAYWEMLQPVIFPNSLTAFDRLMRMFGASMLDHGRYVLTVLARPKRL